MTDIRVVTKVPFVRPKTEVVAQPQLMEQTIADWLLLPDGTLDETQELATLVKVALMTDRLADPDEVLPDPDSTDRRGWWGDYQAEVIWDGWPVGTKNWLLLRAKIADPYSMEGDTVMRAEQYTREALQPLVAKKICTRIDVKAVRSNLSGKADRIDVSVTIYRGPNPEIELQFQDMWNAMISGG